MDILVGDVIRKPAELGFEEIQWDRYYKRIGEGPSLKVWVKITGPADPETDTNTEAYLEMGSVMGPSPFICYSRAEMLDRKRWRFEEITRELMIKLKGE